MASLLLRRLGFVVATAFAAASFVVCGARTELDLSDGAELAAGHGPTSTATGVAGATTSAGGQGGQGATEGGGTPVLPCRLQQVGPPAAPSFQGQPAVTPSIAVVDPGNLTTETLARVAMQAVTTTPGPGHNANLTGLFAIDRPWPAGLLVAEPMVELSVDSRSYGLLAHSTAPQPRIALVHVGDPSGQAELLFRAMDVDTWVPEPWAAIGPVDSASDFVGGAAVAGAAYQGLGYAVGYWQTSWGGLDPIAYVLVVDETGLPTFGPVELPGSAGPSADVGWGLGPSLAWTGTSYAVATVGLSCDGGDCVGSSLIAGRIAPEAADGFELLASFDPLGDPWEGWKIGRPALAVVGQELWLSWGEGMADSPGLVRLSRMALDGSSIGLPTSFELPLLTVRPIALSTGNGVGPALSWIRDGDTSLPDGALGRSFAVTQPLTSAGELDGEPVEAPIFGAALRFLTAASSRYPHGLLVAYSTHEASYLHRLDCGDTLPLAIDPCQPCPGAPPAAATPCSVLEGVFCRYPSLTPKPYSVSRCEGGHWVAYGPPSPPPDQGCPLSPPAGPCSSADSCLYADQGAFEVTRCECSAAASWQCFTSALCEPASRPSRP